ncbi:MAG: M48 family metallopeptidase [bacterium]
MAHPPPETLQIEGREIPLKLRINRRAKRVILKVDNLHPAVLLTVPSKRQISTGLRFIEERYHWIAGQLLAGPQPHPFCPDQELEIMGKKYRLTHVEGRHAARFHPNAQEIIVGGERQFFNRRMIDFLRKFARSEFEKTLSYYCHKLGKDYHRLTIRDGKTSWGSCSSDAGITLSWRLILAPVYVCHYVIAHEVAHLVHLDHSAQFWAVVQSLYKDYPQAQQWLKKNGGQLHAYGVTPATSP